MPVDGGISVVCPTYNSAKYIKRTLDSLLAQDVLPEQVVFSDDGSSDDTIEQIETYKKIFNSKGVLIDILKNKHGGPGAARNHAITIANQPWIAFLDSDDTWKPSKLKKVRRFIMQNSKTNCLLHWEEYVRIDGSLGELKHGDHFDPDTNLSRQLYRSNFLSTSAVICRRDLIEKVGCFDVNLPNGQDYELWLRMSPFMTLSIIKEVLGSYIEEPKSITARPYYVRLPAEFRIAWKHRDKGDVTLLIYKLIRMIVNKQWFGTIVNILMNRKGHSTL